MTFVVVSFLEFVALAVLIKRALSSSSATPPRSRAKTQEEVDAEFGVGGNKGGAGKGKWDGSCGTKAYTFDTAEDFWCLYNNIKRASQIPDRSDYYLFIDGIEPKYEDEVRDNYTIPRFQVAIIACLNNKW